MASKGSSIVRRGYDSIPLFHYACSPNIFSNPTKPPSTSSSNPTTPNHQKIRKQPSSTTLLYSTAANQTHSPIPGLGDLVLRPGMGVSRACHTHGGKMFPMCGLGEREGLRVVIGKREREREGKSGGPSKLGGG